jgi:hypothetical protein
MAAVFIEIRFLFILFVLLKCNKGILDAGKHHSKQYMMVYLSQSEVEPVISQ